MATDFSKYGTPIGKSNNGNASTQTDFSKYGTPIAESQISTPTMNAEQESVDTYGALFPAKTGESPIMAGLKATGNVIPSAVNLAKGIGSALWNIKDTVKGIGRTAAGGVEKLIPGQQGMEHYFDKLIGFMKERYGSLENLQRTATNDPFGFGTDVLGLLTGGAGLAGKTAALDTAISKTAQTALKPVAKVAGSAKSAVGKTTAFGVSQATGLNPETIKNIIDNPTAFTKEALDTTTRANLGKTVEEAINARLDNLSDIGSGYETIKKSAGQVAIPKGTVESVLDKYGIKVVDGKVKITSEAKPLTSADKTALEDFINVYGNEEVLSNNAYLNARAGLSQLSKYDAAKTGNLTPIARELRGVYDEFGKTQVKGLAELDAQYAPEVKTLTKIKKDYLNKDGSFKDGAVNKIANLTGAGKEQILGRLEQIVPGIEQRVKIVKAAEDIDRAAGLKVGTYARAGLGVFGVGTMNLPAIITAIIASPEIAVNLLKGYGLTKSALKPISQILYGIANDVNNFRLPGGVQSYVGKYMEKYDLTKKKLKEKGYLPKTPKEAKGGYIRNPLAKSAEKPAQKSSVASLAEEAKKYKITVNIQDKNDLEYLGRILSEDNIRDIKSGKMTNFRGKSYEDLAQVNIVSETPKTVAEQLKGKISDVKLKGNTFYHGTSAENAKEITRTGFKTGASLPESTFRGGGYGRMQNSISLTETPKDASRFSTLSKNGQIIEVKLKDGAKVVSIKGIEDANDLEDYISYLNKQRIDAVYIGGGEKELVVINPKAIVKTKLQNSL